MPIEDKVETYSVRLQQDNFLGITRTIRLSLESGGTEKVVAIVRRKRGRGSP